MHLSKTIRHQFYLKYLKITIQKFWSIEYFSKWQQKGLSFKNFLIVTHKHFATNRFLRVSNKCMRNFSSFSLVAFELHFVSKLRSSRNAIWHFKIIRSSKVRMLVISKLLNALSLNLVSMAKFVCRIDIWNQNWMLQLEILKLLHLLIWRLPPKIMFLKNN